MGFPAITPLPKEQLPRAIKSFSQEVFLKVQTEVPLCFICSFPPLGTCEQMGQTPPARTWTRSLKAVPLVYLFTQLSPCVSPTAVTQHVPSSSPND